jgi:hypothetical protein
MATFFQFVHAIVNGDLDAVSAIATIAPLLERSARSADRDGRGKSVRQATSSDWIRAVLKG